MTHGGHGSTLGALAHGVPLVVLPLFALDQWFNAEAVARSGRRRRARRRAPHPPRDRPPRRTQTLAALRPAVEHVLADPGPRAAAQRIAAEMRALPPIDTAPAALEAIATLNQGSDP